MTNLVPLPSPAAVTWEEFERATIFRRPSDWLDRPDGPDRLDIIAAEAQASGVPITRDALLAAMAVAPEQVPR